MFRRLRPVILLLLTLAALAPALGAHACVDEDCATISLTAQASADTPDEPCSDCGQACANGCCHAPHPATAPELPHIQTLSTYACGRTWAHATEPPLADAAGPLRPPRS